jgi:integrase
MKGKTGKRIVVPHIEVAEIIEAMLARRGEPKPEDLLFAMPAGGQIITLADQFDALLADAGMTRNSAGEKFTLYSLRHFYAVRQIARGTDIYTIARNMGTSVAMIEQYYAKHATSPERATKLGGERGSYHRAKGERVELDRGSPATLPEDIAAVTVEIRALIDR